MATSLIDSCCTCGGAIDLNQPGHVEGLIEGDIEHSVCHDLGKTPKMPIIDLSNGSKRCINIQYNCGHYAYAPIGVSVDTCPECGDEPVDPRF